MASSVRRATTAGGAGEGAAPSSPVAGSGRTAGSGGTATSNPTIARKLKKVLQIRTDAPDFLSALDSLSEYFGENTLAARRGLYTTVEKRGLDITKTFLAKFSTVLGKLEQVEEDVKALGASCESITQRLADARHATDTLVRLTEELHTEQRTKEQQANMIAAFLHRFQLSPEEEAVLQARDVGTQFFLTLERMQAIQKDCALLMQTHHQRAGLEIMDAMAAAEEAAYETLYRWLQRESAALGNEFPDLKPQYCPALRALRARPVLYDLCRNDVLAKRKESLVQRFLTALVHGGPHSMPRPIEMHAHDPVRYVNDILAWLHQAIAAEKEVATALFGSGGSGEAQPSPSDGAQGGTAADGTGAQQMLDTVLEAVVEPFQRVDAVMQREGDMVVCFKVADLLGFYAHTVEKMVGAQCPIVQAFHFAKRTAMSQLHTLLDAWADKLLHAPPAFPADLSPPHVVQSAVGTLKHMLDIYDASMIPVKEEAHGMDQLLKSVLRPVMTVCEAMGKSLDGPDRAVFLINSYSAMQGPLTVYAFTQHWVEELAGKLDEHMDFLIQAQAARVMQSSGMADKLGHVRTNTGAQPLSQVLGMDAPALTAALQTFYAEVVDCGILSLPRADMLLNPRLRGEARNGTMRLLLAAYTLVFEAVCDAKNEYEGVDRLFSYSPAQMATLFGV